MKAQLRREYFENGQKPKVIAITCSDARIDLPFKYGEAFVIRTAGNILDRGGWESLKYGVLHTTAQRIMVIGHNKCGAVKAYKEGVEGFGFITSTIEENVRIAKERFPILEKPPAFSLEEAYNTLGMAMKIAEQVKQWREMPVEAHLQNLKTGYLYYLRTF